MIARRLLPALLVAFFACAATAEMPITTDSRIKTFVYNENEVYSLTTHYGYQSNIEFGEKETIETVSIGDRVAWQIIPAGRRMFIRAMEENAHTNMTIVTNLRAYQLDLRSSASNAVFGSEELTYVVRFYYPGESSGAPPMASYSPPAQMAPAYSPPQPTFTNYAPPMAQAPAYSSAPAYAPPQSYNAPMPAALPPLAPVSAPMAPAGAYNYRYTYSGPGSVAPVKIYDDGRSTFFKYRSGTMPRISVITARGEQLEVPVRNVGGNIVAVDILAPRFSLNQPGGQVIVYNEAGV